ncbi:MAG: FAD-binding and (Fe-S)-binding domain-containing protein, partial [Terriglobales bacterium]
SDKSLGAIVAAGGPRGQIYAALQSLRDQYGDLVRARYPKIPRRVSGYNLDELLPENGFQVARALVGSESTCAIILAAKLRLLPSPSARPLAVLGYASAGEAGDHVCAILEHHPIGLEGFDDVLIAYLRDRGTEEEDIRLLPPGAGWLLVEFGADRMADAEHQAQKLLRAPGKQPHPPAMRLFTDAAEIRRVWRLREVAVGVTSFTPDKKVAWPGWEDSAVPPEKLGPYIRDLRALLREFGYHASIFGHFGQACLHMRIDFNLRTADGVRQFRRFIERAADRVAFYGGSVSGEHGDGQARAELLPKMFGADLVRGLEAFKAIWDPDWKLNPGKMVAAYKLDENLRLGPAYRPAQPATYFQFPDDHGFAQATLRCSGLGECRRETLDAGTETMCPSYLVTREEMHSTRGRAHLLWEMLQGGILKDGWRNRDVRQALDLCLSCKGCRRDCPVNVDMASYKAEFLAHYYQGRIRPRSAYAMGKIREWLEIAGRFPRLANACTQIPGLSFAAKLAAGISWRRPLPPLASPTFRQWFSRHGLAHGGAGGPEVVLWPDTFTDFFAPSVGRAAVKVLQAAGCHLTLPPPGLCCGRPLYDYGMLPRAQQRLREIFAALGPVIDAGTPVIVLEPSCAAVFRDEAVNLFPHDERAHRLRRQTFTLAEFLQAQLPGYQPPRLRRRALVHGHCHHKAILNWSAEPRLLQAMGLEFEVLSSGCCGMAGSFGYEAQHYGVSRAAGERVLLPAVRRAAKDTVILADGFSCREQIAQLTRRRALHLAQLLALALPDAPEGAASHPPERAFPESIPSGLPLALPVAAAVAAAYFAFRRRAA